MEPTQIKGILRDFKHLSLEIKDEDLDTFLRGFWTARQVLGWDFTFYLPGMVRLDRLRGRYPAISITGDRCELLCRHCRGRLLEPMIKVRGPNELRERLNAISRNGMHGVLLTGGSDKRGMLPWEPYLEVIREFTGATPLFVSGHTGFLDNAQARDLGLAGMRQGLLDVMGSEGVVRSIYNLPSISCVIKALGAIKGAGMELVPHIVAGLDHGKIEGEYEALEILRDYPPDALVIVTLTPLKGTPMEGIGPPLIQEVGRLISRARLSFPGIPISLGCERQRGPYSTRLEIIAVLSGINRMALWSEEAISFVERLGFRTRFQFTCCSVPPQDGLALGPEGLAHKMSPFLRA